MTTPNDSPLYRQLAANEPEPEPIKYEPMKYPTCGYFSRPYRSPAVRYDITPPMFHTEDSPYGKAKKKADPVPTPPVVPSTPPPPTTPPSKPSNPIRRFVYRVLKLGGHRS